MGDPKPPREGMGQLVDRMKAISYRLEMLESPSATARRGTRARLTDMVAHISARRVDATSGVTRSLDVPADGTWRWYPTIPPTRLTGLQLETGVAIVEGGTVECRVVTGGGTAGGALAIRVLEASGRTILPLPLAGNGLTTTQTVGTSTHVTTVVNVNPIEGPFDVELFVATYADSANTSTPNVTFAAPTLAVKCT